MMLTSTMDLIRLRTRILVLTTMVFNSSRLLALEQKREKNLSHSIVGKPMGVGRWPSTEKCEHDTRHRTTG
jgi:hypothetical protein